MNVVSRPGLPRLPLPLAMRINQICNQFEATWKNGQRPHLEDFLQEVDEADRLSLLRELVLVEIAYRQQAGDKLDSAEYRARFPALDTRLLEQEIATTQTPRHIGRYAVERELGRGSFGIVYLARDEQLERSVAIKVPHRQFVARPEDAGPYLTEARTVAVLDHPNIVSVHDVGSNEDFPCFIVSQYVEGSTLFQKYRAQRPSIAEAAAMVATIAKALHYAHLKGLVHRDITPGNIMIDKSGAPFVVDFGLALKEENVGHGPHFAGTPPYMSPEQARGEGHRVDGRSDIFSLGVVFYELITGRRPFRGESRDDLFEQIVALDARPPRQINDAIPKEIERICLKALSKRAAERYLIALDLAEDLERWLAGGDRGEAADAPITVLPSRPIPDDSGPHKILPKGLHSYDTHDANFFLDLLPGPRDRDGLPDSIRFWKTRIEEADADSLFTVGLIYGPSGCGKSSLVKAGLLPRLADNVIAIYVESTAEETERRLLSKLRQRCPALPSKLGLKKSLALLRSGQAIPPNKKVLIVLDQFEQWLHAKRDEENTELVQALRQCDGARLQCIVLVRDDFWMAATRFMRALEIQLRDGQNSAVVDLFPIRHAENVLAAFGRAFGTLPESGPIGKEHKQFLELAIRGLAQEGKVICIRLALFAEMMKGATWTPSTLKVVGGAEGVGVAFLKSTFAAPTAPPQKAARAVLKALLPETGTDIRGHMRSRAELLDASGYENRANEFDELIRILDSDVRLITPTDREGKERNVASAPQAPSGQYYQLTHDFLVPSVRDWLTREQKETRRGRVELLLADRAAVWNDRPENRQFPSLLQWFQIRLLTQKKHRTQPQRKMIRAAERYYMRRGLAVVTCLILLGLVGWEGFGRWQASMLRDRLLSSKTTDVPTIVEEMAPFRRWIDPMLLPMYARAQENSDSGAQLHAALALLPSDPNQLDYLYERLLTEEPPEVIVIRETLLDHKPVRIEQLWTRLENPKNDQKVRFGASCALARFDAGNPRWEKVGAGVAAMLVTQKQFLMPQWTDAFKPVGKWLLPALASFLQDEEYLKNRSTVADVYGAYAADVADAYERLEKQLAETEPSANQRIAFAKRQANIASALLLLGRPEPVWPLLKHGPNPTLRSFLIDRIAPSGVDPHLLINRLEVEKDRSVKSAILLSLGDIGLDRLPPVERQNLIFGLLHRYWNDPDPGIHGAAQWLLRKWQAKDKLEELVRDLATREIDAKRQWYMNRQGHTMILVTKTREFWMGDDSKEQKKHRREIGRSFAIAANHVTVEQFLRFRPTHEVKKQLAPEVDCPIHNVTWYEAAEYCNWLSKSEGIAESEWCYMPNQAGQYDEGMKMAPGHLKRTGYRLPTEAEWEYACRAGAETTWFFGLPSELLSKYAWYGANSLIKTHPVGLLKPNDLGLFDINGNVWVWTENAKKPYAISDDGKLSDDEGDTEIYNEQLLVVRGGAYDSYYFHLNSAQRLQFYPNGRTKVVGFRPVRTLALD